MIKLSYCKGILLLSAILLLGSCQATKLTNRSKEIKTFAIDFREYAKKGFLFMPDEYYGEYEVLGAIRAELHPSVSYWEGKLTAQKGFRSRLILTETGPFTQIKEMLVDDELIQHIYDLATAWGGNAFSHFQIFVKTDYTDPGNLNSYYEYYEISGLVIRRK